MMEKLRAVRARYEELGQLLQQPDVAADPAQYARLMKEYKNLTPLAQACDAYAQAQHTFEGAKELLEEGGLEPELKEMAQQEYSETKQRLEQLEEEIRLLLLPKDENDEKNVIVEIRGGAGGEEAALFAHSLYRMYNMYAEARGWKTELLGANVTELGGMKEVSFSIDGAGAYSRMKCIRPLSRWP